MTAALPRLKVQPIPGGQPPPPPPEEIDSNGNPIGRIIEGVTDFFRGDRDEPPPSEFEDRPRREPRRREEPQY
jgi:penicillin-binding protein 1A